ncbi:P-loop containing nucleoside triphosphate hydrolase protein [Heliocybe sulcata]|uniref:P-loop containing nucleoside triphosphate hydrolase protein n=1 Tax=Heliocybe sulcata TaxID=5364 RepID=A0A5C3NBN2_9AGAM|nr:P-loop containing nucleoside triphosphate hydrolase protein [Heliocybe sulcata]
MVARNNHASPSPSTHSHSSKPYNAPPLSAPINRPISWLKFSHTRPSSRASLYDQSPARALSRLSEPSWHQDGDEASDDEDHDRYDHRTVRKTPSPLPGAAPSRTRPVSSIFHSPPASALPTVSFSSRRASSIYLHSPVPTPKPTLMFAIASDDVDEVKRVLDSGEAGPNEQVGPQSALAFVLTNERLKNKIGIVKELLKHGADPGALRSVESNPPEVGGGEEEEEEVVMLSPPRETTLEGMDPATRYYISMADNTDTRRASALIHRSFFRPLARVRYDIIGQDRALEQLFRVLSMNSQSFSVAPLVVLLCGPSGHGKSLLARKFGSLLEVPTHTVNMTTLRSTHDIWQSHSMNPYEEPSSSTLAEFLIDNERKRCVVVLDVLLILQEIDKTEDEKFLLSLLMPWELGRCSPEAGRRHIDVRKVIWIGTSNIGHDLVFAHEAERAAPYSKLSRDEYVELMKQLRPVVSDRLGPSLISRVTTVLPFVPFTEDEKMAIAAEALFTLGKDIIQSLTPETVEGLIRRALEDYLSDEGARCLYRSVSTLLLDLPM